MSVDLEMQGPPAARLDVLDDASSIVSTAPAPAPAAATAAAAAAADADMRESVQSVLKQWNVDGAESLEQLEMMTPDQLTAFVEAFTPQQIREMVSAGRQAGWLEKTASVTFRNLYYKRKGDVLVNGVSAYIKPGMMVSVMGPGATHLFQAILGRNRDGRVSGEVLVNRKPPDHLLERIIGYVPKDDVHLPTLTVRETLLFSSRLRSRPELSPIIRVLKAELVMKTLGLSHAANTVVGDGTLRGISGGEKRRLSVGVEFVAGHSLTIADLPTNGLDSATALDFIQKTRFASQAGSSAMYSLVQASPELFSAFDRVLCLSRGSCMYFGPPTQVMAFLNSAGFRKPGNKTVPDYITELMNEPAKFYHAELSTEVSPITFTPAVSDLSDSTESKVATHADQETTAAKVLLRVFGEPSKCTCSKKALEKTDLADQRRELNGAVLTAVLEDGTKIEATSDEQGEAMLLLPLGQTTVRVRKETFSDATKSVFVQPVQSGIQKADVTLQQPCKGAWCVLRHHYTHSKEFAQLGQVLWRDLAPDFTLQGEKEEENDSLYNASTWDQVKEVFKRQIVIQVRNKPVSIGGIMRSIFVALIVGLTFFDLGKNEADVRARIGLFFFVAMNAVMSNLQIIPILVAHRAVFYVQRSSGYFWDVVYYFAFVLVGLPFALLETFLFSTITYALAGLQGGVFSEEFWFFFLMIYMAALTGRSFMFLTSTALPNAQIAQSISPIFMVFFALAAGFLLPRNSIPDFWIWLHYGSFLTYIIRGLSLNEYQGQTGYTCSLPDQNLCPFKTGEDLLAFYDMQGESSNAKWGMLLWTLGFTIVFNLAALLALKIVDHSGEVTIVRKNKDEELFEGSVVREEESKLAEHAAYLEIKHLTYKVMVPGPNGKGKVEKILLHDVNFYAQPGRMVALMGASGAGKSTLMDVIAGKKTGGVIEGDILVNGEPKSKFFSRYAGYVEQSDSHVPTATVKEAIDFSAKLRLPPTVTEVEREQRVSQVMRDLDLSHLADTVIGSYETGGISPENRKKVTIAVELIMNPGVLFLDEPTTGLDSASAMGVMTTVRRLAHRITVVCTVHQPSQEIVDTFDDMLLLQPGGYVMYSGKVANVAGYLEKVGMGQCPEGANVADFVLESIRDRLQQLDESDEKGAVQNPKDIYLQSTEHKSIMAALEQGVSPDGHKSPSYNSVQASSKWTQFVLLIERFFLQEIRDAETLKVRIGSAVVVAFAVGTLYIQLSDDGPIDNQARIALAFFLVLFKYFSAQSIIPRLVDFRAIYFREHTNGMYTPLPFYAARTIADIPWVLLQACIFSIILFWLTNFAPEDQAENFALFLGGVIITTFNGYALNELLASLAPDAEIATLMSAMVLTIWMIFTGFLIVEEEIPDYFQVLFFFNPVRYPLFYTSIIALEREGCEGAPPTQPGCNGSAILGIFGMDPDDRGVYIGVTIAFFIGFRILSYLSLRYLNHIKR